MSRPAVDEARNPWKRVSSDVVYENPWISVRHESIIDPSGTPGIYGVVSPRNFALGVLPFFNDGTVVVVGQYRYSLNQYSWEMPEGGGALDVDPLTSIKRELQEEAGQRASQWHPILRNVSLSNSISTERAHTWAAWGLEPVEGSLDSTEADLISWRLSFDDLVAMVWSGEVHDAMTVMTVAKVEAMRWRNELPHPLKEILS